MEVDGEATVKRCHRLWMPSWALVLAVACADLGDDGGTSADGAGALPQPANVVAAIEGDAIRLTWELDAAEGIEAVVFRAVVVDEVGSGFVTEWHVVGAVPGHVTQYQDVDVALGTAYTYAVASRRGSQSSEPVPQSNSPVVPGGGEGLEPSVGPVEIEHFEVSPRWGTGAVTATFTWLLEADSHGAMCRLTTGDGASVELEDCGESTSYEHTYAADASGVLVATLETIRFEHVRREHRGIAVNVNPDESRFLVLAAQRADGLPVAGAVRFAGNVQVVAIDRLGGLGHFSGNLDAHGSTVIASYSDGPTDLTPYTLLALLNTTEDYGTVLASFDGVDGPGTLYLNTEAPELARIVFGTSRAGDRLGYAYVLHEDTHGADARPPVNCCLAFDPMNSEHLVHAEPRPYRFVFAGATGAGEDFFLSEEVVVDGDGAFTFDPASRPHGRLRVSALDRWGQPLDVDLSLELEEASFWPREGSRDGWAPRLGTRATELLLHPGAYRVPIAGLRLDAWELLLGVGEVSLEVGSTTTLDLGGDFGAALRVEDAPVPGGEVRSVLLIADVTDVHGNVVSQVFDRGATGGSDVTARFRVFDPDGTLVLDAEADRFAPDRYRLELPDGVPEGTYAAEVVWDLGPFAAAPLTAQTTFVVGN